MAKPSVTVTVLLFTLSLTLSVVSSKMENEIIDDNLTTLSAEPDPDTTNSTLGSGPELTSSDEITIPVNFVNFHPINRHFPRRPLTTTASFNRHCQHELLRRGFQIPYGNDMIVSGEEKTTGTDPLSDGVVVDIKMLVGPLETKHHEVEAEDNGSMKITVKLMKRGERENMLRRKIRKFLNHLV